MRRDNPFEKVEELLTRMERELETDPFGVSESISVDVRDTEEAFVVTADLPGYGKSDIEVTLADRQLRIDAERESEAEQVDGEYVRKERRQNSVSRSVRLPEAVDEEAVEATHTNGVLTVTLPKAEAGGGTAIDIE